jgi:hypothetical protein
MSAFEAREAELPARMRSLPLGKLRYRVPYFATVIDGEYDFRVVTAEKMDHAIRHQKCWICGQTLGRYKAFCMGPMCAITGTVSDPAQHLECARYAAKFCPFMANPMATRNERGLDPDQDQTAGLKITRNPGVVAVWVSTDSKPYHDWQGRLLIDIGNHTSVEWYKEGRPATADEIGESIATGIEPLQKLAVAEGPMAIKELLSRVKKTQRIIRETTAS